MEGFYGHFLQAFCQAVLDGGGADFTAGASFVFYHIVENGVRHSPARSRARPGHPEWLRKIRGLSHTLPPLLFRPEKRPLRARRSSVPDFPHRWLRRWNRRSKVSPRPAGGSAGRGPRQIKITPWGVFQPMRVKNEFGQAFVHGRWRCSPGRCRYILRPAGLKRPVVCRLHRPRRGALEKTMSAAWHNAKTWDPIREGDWSFRWAFTCLRSGAFSVIAVSMWEPPAAKKRIQIGKGIFHTAKKID